MTHRKYSPIDYGPGAIFMVGPYYTGYRSIFYYVVPGYIFYDTGFDH